MNHFLFATNNKHKLSEIRQILGAAYNITGLSEAGFTEEVPETQDTLEGNALQKARYIHNVFKTDCFADDTGLEVEALGGAPGVYSARYAGESATYADNVNKLLLNMKGKTLRKARFRTVVALILDGKEYLFEGVVNGIITDQGTGSSGFGYDPIFVPDGYTQSFAEMDASLKNAISHRGRAIEKLTAFLSHR